MWRNNMFVLTSKVSLYCVEISIIVRMLKSIPDLPLTSGPLLSTPQPAVAIFTHRFLRNEVRSLRRLYSFTLNNATTS